MLQHVARHRILPSLTLVFLCLTAGLLPVAAQAPRRPTALLTVTSPADSADTNPGDGVCDDGTGHCTLRAAIQEANNFGLTGMRTIAFDLLGSGIHTLVPATPLPAITNWVVIDGYSQAGSQPNTSPGFQSTAVLTIELNGSAAGAGAVGLSLAGPAGACGVRGLIINRFAGPGIQISGAFAATIAGNFIGTDARGEAAQGNATGVALLNTTNDTIGGPQPADRNLISGNRGYGVLLNGGPTQGDNRVQGNLIGTTASGLVRLGNGSGGVQILDAYTDTIGGATTGTGNLIAGNSGPGVAVVATAPGVATYPVIQGNLIGTAADGTTALGNSADGVQISAGSTTLGGPSAGARNIIAGNGGVGVLITGRNGFSALVQGNYIGTTRDGTAALGNAQGGIHVQDTAYTTIGGTGAGRGNVVAAAGGMGAGIWIEGHATTPAEGNLVQGNWIGTNAAGSAGLGNSGPGIRLENAPSTVIGGPAAGAGNWIAYNGAAGVQVRAGIQQSILANAIFANAALGIDLLPAGITPNDPGDPDSGPNSLQNFPILDTWGPGADGRTVVTGTLNSTANDSYTVQVFASTACDPTGNGQGQTFVGATTVQTGADGNAHFTLTLSTSVPLGSFLTSTSTSQAGDTSEFSPCLGDGSPPPTATPTGVAAQTATPTGTATASRSPSATATPVSTATLPGDPTATRTVTPPGGPTATATSTPSVGPAPPCPIQFTDVPAGSTFYANIRCLACRGIVGGYTDAGHCLGGAPCFQPAANVTRGQMSKFIAGAAGYTDAIPADRQTFRDVPPSNVFWLFVERTYAHGVIGGYTDAGHCPGGVPCFQPAANVTRGQTAKFVAGAAGYTEVIPPTQQTFNDVPPSNVFWPFIERVALHNVVGGYSCGGTGEPCPGGYYRPGNPVTRGQTAKFISNAFFPGCQPALRR